MHQSVNVPPWIETNDMVLIKDKQLGMSGMVKCWMLTEKNEKISVIFFTDSKSDPNLLV